MTSSPHKLAGTPASFERRRAWLLRVGPYGSVLLGLSVIVLIWCGFLYFTGNEKAHTERAAIHNADNLARTFEEHIIRSIRAADQTILYVRESYARNPSHFDMSLWSHHGHFLSDVSFQVAVIGADGRMIASNIPGSAPGVDLSDREHFKVHTAPNASDELFISKPVFGRVSRKWSIQLTRRIVMPDASFGGVVVVSLDPNYLAQFYQSIDVGERGVVNLIGTDGVVRARGTKGNAAIGETLATGPLLATLLQSKSGTYVATSTIDGVKRLSVYRQVNGYPLIVTVGLALDEMFQVYNRNYQQDILITLLLTLWMAGATAVMVRYQRALARARDAAEAGTRARSEFLAMMSHEIRTPMNGVVGMAELLIVTKLDAAQLTYTRTLKDSASHLLQIINDVLDFSKLDADSVAIESICFDVRDIVQTTVGVLSAQAEEKGLALTVEIAPDVPRLVVGDPARLRQLLLNLVGNGLKFTQKGRVSVSVRAGRAISGTIRLRFAVADTGIGMPADAIPLLFREFSQLDSSIARRFGGTGLGLAICKRLIDLMNGSISVESEVGRGSTFTFALDYQIPASDRQDSAADVTPLPTDPDGLAAAIAPRHLKILLVEDNRTNQMVALKLLERLGLEAEVANNGVEAVAACEQQHYDLILMDVMMPVLDGMSATKAIRKLPEPNNSPYVVALTANAQSDDRKACLAAGMDDFMSKPFTRNDLREALSRFDGRPRHPDEHSPAEPRPARFDRKIFDELADAIGGDGIRAVAREFILDTRKRFDEMRRAIADGDMAGLRREAHALKSSAASLGLLHLSGQAKALENIAAGVARPELDARIDGLSRTFSEAAETVARRLNMEIGAASQRESIT